MNRRQVLFGAGATALAFGGFVPWANAENLGGTPVSMSVSYEAFTLGIRGSYTLNGTVAGLSGTIPPIVSEAAAGRVPAAAVQNAVVQEPAPVAPVISAPAPVQAAPARAPMMSIVPVSRGSARAVVTAD